MITYPVRALREALGSVVVAAKASTELPNLPGAAVWTEPEEPRHPLAGVVHALEMAHGRAVMICACDLPLVTPGLVRAIARADPGGAPGVMARAEGRSQPLLACYGPDALGPLAAALKQEGVPMLEAVAAIGARVHDVADPNLLFNVNTPEELLQAGALLTERARAGDPISRT
jgi:molybdopterin-guanine dinucleotide biosynthesis protein A